MGGKGSGGARVGSGPKRRTPDANWLNGNPGKRGPRAVPRPTPSATGDVAVARPKDLQPDEVLIWDELAPLAIGLGSLTPARAFAFGLLCRWIVLERKLAAAPLAAAGPDHRGLIQKVEGGLARFRLHGDGKLAEQAPAADEWDEFDGPTLVKRA